MIDFRYHIVSLIAVFLALALGLFLGSTTLQSTVTGSLHSQANRLTKDNDNLNTAKSALGAQVKSEQSLVAATESYAVSDQLAGQSVALIAAPGVSSKTHDALLSTLTDAGASLAADVALQPSFLDPTQNTELGSLAAAIALPNHPLPTGNGATQASAVLAATLVSKPGEVPPSRNRISRALNVLEEGKFIDVAGTAPDHTADLAILLVPAASGSATKVSVASQNAILVSLARDLRSSSTGTVMAGPRPTGGSDLGPLTAARADPSLTKTVSTVNLDDSAVVANPPDGSATGGDPVAGRIAIVLALVGEQNQTVGAFGLGYGASAPIPAPSTSP